MSSRRRALIPTSVGLQAALAEPASAACLHVAEPVRTSARSITLAVTTDLCCNGCTCNTRVESLLLCNLCCRRMNGRIIYMFMSMGFCTEECRNEYFLDYGYRLTMELEAEGSRRIRAEGSEARKPLTEGKAVSYRRIFFTSDEDEPVP